MGPTLQESSLPATPKGFEIGINTLAEWASDAKSGQKMSARQRVQEQESLGVAGTIFLQYEAHASCPIYFSRN